MHLLYQLWGTLCYICFLLKNVFSSLVFRDREEGREQSMNPLIHAFTDLFFYVAWPGIEPYNLGESGWYSHQLSYPGKASSTVSILWRVARPEEISKLGSKMSTSVCLWVVRFPMYMTAFLCTINCLNLLNEHALCDNKKTPISLFSLWESNFPNSCVEWVGSGILLW